MSFRVLCPECGQPITSDESMQGQVRKCPRCGALLRLSKPVGRINGQVGESVPDLNPTSDVPKDDCLFERQPLRAGPPADEGEAASQEPSLGLWARLPRRPASQAGGRISRATRGCPAIDPGGPCVDAATPYTLGG